VHLDAQFSSDALGVEGARSEAKSYQSSDDQVMEWGAHPYGRGNYVSSFPDADRLPTDQETKSSSYSCLRRDGFFPAASPNKHYLR
jgi:hypothetical protein